MQNRWRSAAGVALVLAVAGSAGGVASAAALPLRVVHVTGDGDGRLGMSVRLPASPAGRPSGSGTWSVTRDGRALPVTVTRLLDDPAAELVLDVDTSVSAVDLAGFQSAAADLLRRLPPAFPVVVRPAATAVPARLALAGVAALRTGSPAAVAAPDRLGRELLLLTSCRSLAARTGPLPQPFSVVALGACGDTVRSLGGGARDITRTATSLSGVLAAVDAVGQGLRDGYLLRVPADPAGGRLAVELRDGDAVAGATVRVPRSAAEVPDPAGRSWVWPAGVALLAAVVLLLLLRRSRTRQGRTTRRAVGTRGDLRAALLGVVSAAVFSGSVLRLHADPPAHYPVPAVLAVLVLALVLALRQLSGAVRGPDIHDRQVDHIVGGGLLLIALALFVVRASPSAPLAGAWPDVLALPFFCAGVTCLSGGVRLMARLRTTWLTLLLVWPPLAVLLTRATGAALHGTATALAGALGGAVTSAPVGALVLTGAVAGLALTTAPSVSPTARSLTAAWGGVSGLLAASVVLATDPTAASAVGLTTAAGVLVLLGARVATSDLLPVWQRFPERSTRHAPVLAAPRQRAAVLLLLGVGLAGALLNTHHAPEAPALDARPAANGADR